MLLTLQKSVRTWEDQTRDLPSFTKQSSCIETTFEGQLHSEISGSVSRIYSKNRDQNFWLIFTLELTLDPYGLDSSRFSG